MIYCVIFTTLFALAFISQKKDNEFKEKAFKYSVIFMTIFSALRYYVGHDWESYYNIHSSSSWHLSDHDFIEPGFTLVSKFCFAILHNYESSFQLLTIIFTVTTMLLYYYIINKYSRNKIFSLALLFPMYFLNTVFGQIRYGLVLAICLFSIEYIKDKKFMKFLAIMTVAFLFHFSALFFIPIYFIVNINFSKIFKVIILILSTLFGVIINPIKLLEVLNDKFINSNYLSSKLSLYSNSDSSIFSSSFIYIVIIFIFIYIVYKKQSIRDENMKLMLNMMFWGIVFYIATNRFEIVAFRASSYIFIIEIILIPNIISVMEDKYKIIKNIFVFFVVLYSLYRLYITVFYWIDVFIPYRSFISYIISSLFLR